MKRGRHNERHTRIAQSVGTEPSPALSDAVRALLRGRGIDALAKELHSSPAVLSKVESGLPCKADALSRLETTIQERR